MASCVDPPVSACFSAHLSELYNSATAATDLRENLHSGRIPILVKILQINDISN